MHTAQGTQESLPSPGLLPAERDEDEEEEAEGGEGFCEAWKGEVAEGQVHHGEWAGEGRVRLRRRFQVAGITGRIKCLLCHVKAQ